MSTHNIPKTPLIIPNLQLWGFFQGTQEQARNSHGKRAISVRAIEVLLYIAHVYQKKIRLYTRSCIVHTFQNFKLDTCNLSNVYLSTGIFGPLLRLHY